MQCCQVGNTGFFAALGQSVSETQIAPERIAVAGDDVVKWRADEF